MSSLSSNYMLTVPSKKNECDFYSWMHILKQWNVKKYVIGLEEGKGGYKHWQVRLQLSGEGKMKFPGGVELEFFDWFKAYYPKAHIEKASDTWEYERKEGRFITSEDTVEILKIRFGKPRPEQRKILQEHWSPS